MRRERIWLEHDVVRLVLDDGAERDPIGFEEDGPLRDAEADHHSRGGERQNGENETHAVTSRPLLRHPTKTPHTTDGVWESPNRTLDTTGRSGRRPGRST
jgi:hypothetical protein